VSEISGGVAVTGGASGIGRAAVLACAGRGASVAALDVNAAGARDAAQEALARGAPRAVGLHCDVRDESSVAACLAAADEQIGPLCGLVACAGIERHGLVHELALEGWHEVIDTNLTGIFLACKHALRQMVQRGRGGSVVCISSPLAELAVPGGYSAYCASKGGISALVRSMALDYATHGIRVNAVTPGAVDTPMMWALVPPEEIESTRETINGQVPLGRLGQPAEIAEAIAWLLTDQAAYVSGSHLTVDGGLMARANIDN
jgi:NAD(P)-dependent dehydrogenase (short-subunit alcohol dehydrogenase family)